MLEDVLHDSAWTLSTVETGPLVHGERDLETRAGAVIRAGLFAPEGDETATRVGERILRRATLLLLATDSAGGTVALSAKDRVLVAAPWLNTLEGRAPDARVAWQVQGAPQPLARPGAPAFGLNAQVTRVED